MHQVYIILHRPNRQYRPNCLDRRGDWGDLGDLDANRPDRLDRLDRQAI